MPVIISEINTNEDSELFARYSFLKEPLFLQEPKKGAWLQLINMLVNRQKFSSSFIN